MELGYFDGDLPTIMAFDRYQDGVYRRQFKTFNGTNFYEISEGFKQKVESNQIKPWCHQWKWYKCFYLNYLDIEYIKRTSFVKVMTSLINGLLGTNYLADASI